MKFYTHLQALAELPQRILHPAPGTTASQSRPCEDLENAYKNQKAFAHRSPSPFLYTKPGFLGSSRGVPQRYEHTHKGTTYVMFLYNDRTALLGRYVGNFAALELLPWAMRLYDRAIDERDGTVHTLTTSTREPCLTYDIDDDQSIGIGVMPVLRMGRQSDHPPAARAQAKAIRQMLNKDIRRAFAAIEITPPLAMNAEQIDASAQGQFTYPQFRRNLNVDDMGDIDDIARAMTIKILGQFRQFSDERVSIMGRSVMPDGRLGLPAVRTRFDDIPSVRAMAQLYTAQLTVLLDGPRSPLKLSEQIRRSDLPTLIIGEDRVFRDDLSAHEYIEATAFLQASLPDPASPQVQQLLARLPDLSGARCDALPLAA